MPEPTELPYAKCRELLGAGVIGRVAFLEADGIAILPVNYSVVDECIVMRTSPYTSLAQHARGEALSFEVDHFGYERHQGWSVLARGVGKVIEDPDELARVQRTWDPRPWAGGSRPVYIRLQFSQLTGRRLGEGWTHDDETAVRRSL